MTCVDVVGEDVELRRVSSREWAGPCLRCGGRDRLHVQEDRWFCRSCSPTWRDAVGYLGEIRGMPWRDAYAYLGLERQERDWIPVLRRPAPPRVPSAEWRLAAQEVCLRAAAAIWTPVGQEALNYLRGRGLRDETIRTWGLGYLGRGWHSGLRCAGAAVLIPWWAGAELWQVKLRFLDPIITRDGDELRYLPLTWGRDDTRRDTAPAGQPHLFGADGLAGRDVAILVEGEGDAILLAQEVGNLVGVATLGSCSAPVSHHAAAALLAVARIILAYDTDTPGQDGAAARRRQFPCFEATEIPIRPPAGKDIGDFYQAGGDLREWVRTILER